MSLEDRALDVVDSLMSFLPYARPSNVALAQSRIVAHRGAWGEGFPENTMAAFTRAWQLGVHAVEMDLRWSQDGQVFVHHDPTLTRVLGRPEALADLPSARLEQWGVNSLEEVLAAAPRDRELFLELKGPPNPEKAQRLREILQRHGPERIWLMGFDLNPWLAMPFPGVRWASIGRRARVENTAKVQMITGHYLLTTRGDVRRAQDAGILVGTGFINNLPTFYRELHRGVRYVFTNRPEILLRLQETYHVSR